jgi:outer membrane immunogenic protein
MKKILLGGAALVAMFAGHAMAADMPLKAPVLKAPPPPMVYNWTGCYIGGNIGGKWARTDDRVTIASVPGNPGVTSVFPSASSSTLIGGGQVGCNWQAAGSNWVFGLEGDADGQRWTRTRVQGVLLPPLVVGDRFDIRSDWQASARGRIGYAWDRTMLYATGGVAFTEVKVGANFPIFVGAVVFPATVASDNKTLVGATLGAGLEHAITNNWSLGVEGRYSWYGTQTYNSGLLASLPIVGAAPGFLFAQATQTIRVETFEATARLNYRF